MDMAASVLFSSSLGVQVKLDDRKSGRQSQAGKEKPSSKLTCFTGHTNRLVVWESNNVV